MDNKKQLKYYAVFAGRKTGIFHSWADCKRQVNRYRKNHFKAYATYEEAVEAFSLYRLGFDPDSFMTQTNNDEGYFAVLVGWQEGVYTSRKEAKSQTQSYIGHLCEEYNTYAEATEALDRFLSSLYPDQLESNTTKSDRK